MVQSGQGADELLAGYDWYPPLADVATGAGALDVYAAHFFDRNRQDPLGEHLLQPRWMTPERPQPGVRRSASRPAGGPPPRWTRCCGWISQIMLIDDPVKRVDNMTMAWGLEARTPFLDHQFAELAAAIPPELKLAHGGKGVLKEASRKVLPAAVIDRKKGHFPVPAIINSGGSVSAAGAVTHCRRRRPRTRDLFRPPGVQMLLADPNKNRTTLGSNQLWQLGLLEMWLQAHEIS